MTFSINACPFVTFGKTKNPKRGTWQPSLTSSESPDKAILGSPAVQELAQDFPSLPIRKTVDYTFNTTGKTVCLTRWDDYSVLFSDKEPKKGTQGALYFTHSGDQWIPSHIKTGTRSEDLEPTRKYFQKLFNLEQ